MHSSFFGSIRAVGAVAVFALLATASLAGEYHYGQTLLCADCHTMHFSQTHNWDGTTPVPTTAAANGNWLGATGPNTSLLKAPDSQLCLTCHDGQSFAPDVYGANSGTAYVRQAGAIPNGQAPYEDWKGHTLNQTFIAPGGGASMKLQCTSCHTAHGSANYRNIDGTSSPITYAKGTNDVKRDVFLRSWTLGAISTNYAAQTVDFNEPYATKTPWSAYGKFCRSCHTDFHGGPYDSNMYEGVQGAGAWLMHPTGGADIGALSAGSPEHSSRATFASHPYRVKVMSPTGDWGMEGLTWMGAPSDLSPSCMSCHKAHGNQNPFGLIFLEGSGPLTEEGDANGNLAVQGRGVRFLCGQCHVQ